jgi:hypothetical protein
VLFRDLQVLKTILYSRDLVASSAGALTSHLNCTLCLALKWAALHSPNTFSSKTESIPPITFSSEFPIESSESSPHSQRS